MTTWSNRWTKLTCQSVRRKKKRQANCEVTTQLGTSVESLEDPRNTHMYTIYLSICLSLPRYLSVYQKALTADGR